MMSAADIEDVGWPEPAAVLQRTESTRSCWPSSRRNSQSSGVSPGVCCRIVAGSSLTVCCVGLCGPRSLMTGALPQILGACTCLDRLAAASLGVTHDQPPRCNGCHSRCTAISAGDTPPRKQRAPTHEVQRYDLA